MRSIIYVIKLNTDRNIEQVIIKILFFVRQEVKFELFTYV